jgi:hypothetical protein
MRLLSLLFFLLISLFSCSDSSLAGNTSSETTNGFALSGEGPSNAQIKLYRFDRELGLVVVDSTLSDQQGKFSFTQLDSGKYGVEAWKDSLLSPFNWIELSSEDQTLQIDSDFAEPVSLLCSVDLISVRPVMLGFWGNEYGWRINGAENCEDILLYPAEENLVAWVMHEEKPVIFWELPFSPGDQGEVQLGSINSVKPWRDTSLTFSFLNAEDTSVFWGSSWSAVLFNENDGEELLESGLQLVDEGVSISVANTVDTVLLGISAYTSEESYLGYFLAQDWSNLSEVRIQVKAPEASNIFFRFGTDWNIGLTAQGVPDGDGYQVYSLDMSFYTGGDVLNLVAQDLRTLERFSIVGRFTEMSEAAIIFREIKFLFDS